MGLPEVHRTSNERSREGEQCGGVVLLGVLHRSVVAVHLVLPENRSKVLACIRLSPYQYRMLACLWICTSALWHGGLLPGVLVSLFLVFGAMPSAVRPVYM